MHTKQCIGIVGPTNTIYIGNIILQYMYCNTIVFLLRIPDCNPSIQVYDIAPRTRVQLLYLGSYQSTRSTSTCTSYSEYKYQVLRTTYHVLLVVHALHQGHQVLVLYIPGTPCTRTPRDQNMHAQSHTPCELLLLAVQSTLLHYQR